MTEPTNQGVHETSNTEGNAHPASSAIERATGVAPIASAFIAALSLGLSFWALDKADLAIDLQQGDARESNLLRVEAILLECVSLDQTDEWAASGVPNPIRSGAGKPDRFFFEARQRLATRILEETAHIGPCLDRISIVSPALFDSEVLAYSERVQELRQIARRLTWERYESSSMQQSFDQFESVFSEIIGLNDDFPEFARDLLREQRRNYSSMIYEAD